jgi:hypothetical protein
VCKTVKALDLGHFYHFMTLNQIWARTHLYFVGMGEISAGSSGVLAFRLYAFRMMGMIIEIGIVVMDE